MFISAIVFVVALAMILVEATRPGRSWPRVAGWWGRAALLNGVQVVIVFTAGKTWDGWMTRHRLWSADGLGVTGGAVAGYLAITFIYYWWHRWRHEKPFLWRWLHQLHHSPQRIEIITSFYKHPFEIIVNGLLSSVIAYLLVGLGPEAAVSAILLTGLAELFYHWNVNTPHWLGYIVQRPESHCVHHQQGVHWYNFADLPLWDLMFGTFRNPRSWEANCGLGPENERRIREMLSGMDLRVRSKAAKVST
jgi:sterol desaturase/sphingolipid hydroxylase (fatty acid hydroxylase superfamily)